MRYYVRSEDGTDYAVARWVDGSWVFGDREDAIREARLLRQAGEPGAYVIGRTR